MIVKPVITGLMWNHCGYMHKTIITVLVSHWILSATSKDTHIQIELLMVIHWLEALKQLLINVHFEFWVLSNNANNPGSRTTKSGAPCWVNINIKHALQYVKIRGLGCCLSWLFRLSFRTSPPVCASSFCPPPVHKTSVCYSLNKVFSFGTMWNAVVID